MNQGWKVFLLFVSIFAAALGAERSLVPDIVPIAFAEDPQPQWAVQVAFLLRTIEWWSATVSILALALTLAVWCRSWMRRHIL